MPFLSRLYIRGRDEAELLLARVATTHLVSFRDLGASPLEEAHRVPDRIELEFDDASSQMSAAFGYRPPQPEDMRLLVDWLRERQRALCEGVVLFQCEQGISRSTAAAIIALRVVGASHEEAKREVGRVRAGALPNPLMLSLAEPFLRN
jgi:predicted protein tyrosine phosphatase